MKLQHLEAGNSLKQTARQGQKQHVNPEACALSHCTVSASLELSAYAPATLHFRISFDIQFPFEYLKI